MLAFLHVIANRVTDDSTAHTWKSDDLRGNYCVTWDYIIWNFVRMRIKVTKLRCFDSEILEKSCFEQAKPGRVWPNLTQNCDTEFHHNCERSSAVNQLTKTQTAQNFDLTKVWIGYPPPEGDGDFLSLIKQRKSQWWCCWCCLKCWCASISVYSCSISYFTISVLTCSRGF